MGREHDIDHGTGTPSTCQKCGASLIGDDIPAHLHQHYSPPYRFSRAIAIVDPYEDRQVAWRCPDCTAEWPS